MKILSTIRSYINSRKESLLLFVFILCIPTIVQAEISIRNNWDTDGKLFLEGVGWNAEFRKQDGGLIICSNEKTVKILPFSSEHKNSQKIVCCEVIEDNKSKQVEIRALFSTGQEQIEGSFLFDIDGTTEIKPSQNMKGISIFSKISYGVLPGVILDDIIYDPKKYRSDTELHIPSENLFVGLLKGNDGIVVCAWPSGNQKVKLLLADSEKDNDLFKVVKIQLDGNNAFVRLITTGGIWHKEKLLPIYLEKDTEIEWQRPFPAKWKTHLNEVNNIKTAFSFKSKKNRGWRPRIGWYIYPVWFKGQRTMFHLSKKVPPTGDALIYALEGREDTAVEFARKHLGSISTLKPKQRLRIYPENSAGFHNCDGRDRVKEIFKAGLNVKKKDLLQKVMSDFLYSINIDARRLEEYINFIARMNEKIESWSKKEKDNPELQSFLRHMRNDVKNLEQEYHSRMGGKTASEYLRHETRVIEKLKVLIKQQGPEVYSEASRLLGEIRLWSLMEEVPGCVGALAREWARQAGYGCAQNMAAVEYAEKIRKEIRKFIGTDATYETIY